MNRGTRLKARREELKHANKDTSSDYTLRGVAEHVGITGPGLAHLERTDAMPDLRLGLALAEYYGKSVQWVLTGKDSGTEHGVPIVGTTTTGPSEEFLKSGVLFPQEFQYVNMPMGSKKYYALKIDGNINSVSYRAGDVLIVDPDAPVIYGEDYVVRFRDESAFSVLTLANIIDGEYIFNSLTENRTRIVKSEGDVLHVHPIIAVAKASVIKRI